MININGLKKQYGARTVVDGLTLAIRQGEAFGLLGPNGAGKTTTIRMLTMLTSPTDGEIMIAGKKMCKNEQYIKQVIGVVPQHINLDNDLTAKENLDLHGKLHHIPAVERNKRIAELLEFVELADRNKDMVNTFSGGMKRRLMIARALLHQPQILFLDEPTVGLDPQVRRRLWDLIHRLKNEGLTVMLTTHYIEEAESLCDRVAILEKGKLIALDTPAALCRGLGDYVVEWNDEDGMKTQFFSTRIAAAKFAGSISYNTAIRNCNLEDVFVELTGRKVDGPC